MFMGFVAWNMHLRAGHLYVLDLDRGASPHGSELRRERDANFTETHMIYFTPPRTFDSVGFCELSEKCKTVAEFNDLVPSYLNQ